MVSKDAVRVVVGVAALGWAGREAIKLDGEQAFLAGAKRIVELIDERS